MKRVSIGLFALAGTIATAGVARGGSDSVARLRDLVVDGHVTVDRLVQAVGGAGTGGSVAPAGAPVAPSIAIGSASGTPGAQVSFDATLHTAGASVVATQNDLTFDSVNTPIAVTPMGGPDCVVNPSINKGNTIFAFRPIGCAGTACTMIRAIVISFFNLDLIPDGSVLYTCKVDISPGAAAGPYPLAISNVVMSTPEGQSIPGATGTDGEIVVSGPSVPTSKDDCKKGGWQNFPQGFKNQGECIQFVNRGE